MAAGLCPLDIENQTCSFPNLRAAGWIGFRVSPGGYCALDRTLHLLSSHGFKPGDVANRSGYGRCRMLTEVLGPGESRGGDERETRDLRAKYYSERRLNKIAALALPSRETELDSRIEVGTAGVDAKPWLMW